MPTDWFPKAALAAADAGFDALMSTPEPLYLWHKRGGLKFAAEKPGPEWSLTDPRLHRGSMTREQMRAWTLEVARRAPCLPPDESDVTLATLSVALTPAIKLNGREYKVDVLDGKLDEGRPVYKLTGKRGAEYLTVRNRPNPDLMFVIAERGGFSAGGLRNVWLSDLDGALKQVR
jgi:hypothetical protein